jgi:lipoate-protein ligase A
MATDAALLESVGAGAPPAFRLYRWSPPCLSFGRNQPAHGLYDADLARARGLDLVRRPTGGLAVLHDDEVTYAAVTPAARFGGPRGAYRALNAILVGALRRLGVAAELAAAAAPAAALTAGRVTAPCFDAPAPGEIVAGGRKLVGSAQRTERRTILQHGSILLAGGQARVLDVMAAGTAAPAGDHATLAEVLGARPAWDDVVAAIVAAFPAEGGIPLASAQLSRGERARARALVAHFDDDAWTWRR